MSSRLHLCCFSRRKTAYEMRISDWSSDVCSSDLRFARQPGADRRRQPPRLLLAMREASGNIGAEARGIGVGKKRLLRDLDEPRAGAVIIDRLDDPERGGRFAHAQQQSRAVGGQVGAGEDRKSTRLNTSH